MDSSQKATPMTKERLDELAKNPQNRVYQYKYDQVDVLPMAQVQEYARKIYLWRCKYQRDFKPYNESKAREALLEQAKVEGDGMYRFCTYTHKPFFDHLTRLEAGIREFRNVLEMIEVKRRIMEGADEATLLGGFKSRLLEQYSQSASKSSSSSSKESKKARK